MVWGNGTEVLLRGGSAALVRRRVAPTLARVARGLRATPTGLRQQGGAFGARLFGTADHPSEQARRGPRYRSRALIQRLVLKTE
jgi:hypothetical protein